VGTQFFDGRGKWKCLEIKAKCWETFSVIDCSQTNGKRTTEMSNQLMNESERPVNQATGSKSVNILLSTCQILRTRHFRIALVK